MAIINCPDCGQQVSSTAKACPSCGYDVAQQLRYKSRRQGCGVFAIIAAVIVVTALANSGKSPPAAGDLAPVAVPARGQTWFAKGEPIGCRDSKDLNRLRELARQDDADAFVSFYTRQSIAGRCARLKDGDPVYIEETSIFGSPCVRPKGDPYCLYVMLGFLRQ